MSLKEEGVKCEIKTAVIFLTVLSQLVTNPELLCRYNEELTQVFMSCNLMGGMFQRLGTRDTPQGSVIPFLIWALSSH